MRSDRGGFITDILYLFLLRMKLILKDVITVAVLFVSVVIFALIVRSMTVSAEDLSSLPIGVVDLDHTKSSGDLVSGLKKVETLRIMEGSKEKLQKLLMDEMIQSLFIIEQGYEEKLKSGELDEIITMLYKKDNKSASILSDIVAGEIVYPASQYTGYRYYETIAYEGKKLSEAQYLNYINELVKDSGDFNFAFQLNYKNPGEQASSENSISNSVLYNQFIFGILGILIAFIAMFILSQTVREKEMGVEVRLKVSRFGILKRDFGNLSALLIWEGALSLLFTVLIFGQLHSKDLGLWMSAYLLLMLNALVLGLVMLLLTKVIRKMLVYQIFGSVVILLTGGVGFYYLLTGFYQGIMENSIKIIPNSWFIMGFTDIIVNGRKGGYLKEGHEVLLIMAVVLILLVIGIDLIQSFHRKIKK
jgi:ABC-2 type transport system permease protein